MRLIQPACLLALLPAFASSAGAQTQWYVSAGATPPGNGTLGQPFPSIQQAVTNRMAHQGDTVHVFPGTYVENVGHGPQISQVALVSTAGAEFTKIQGSLQAVPSWGNSITYVEGFTVETSTQCQFAGVTVRRCVFRNPGPAGSTNALFVDSPTLENCVISGYHTVFIGFASAAQPIQFRNTAFAGNDLYFSGGFNMADFQYCCGPLIPSVSMVTQSNCIVADPGFVDTSTGDYHLSPSSPCIDTGPAASLDPDGSILDIGVFPVDPDSITADFIYCASELNGDGCFGLVQTSGTCSASSTQPFLVSAHGVPPNKSGLLVYSNGPANIPFEGGTLCVAGPIHRTPASNSGSNGMPPPLDQCSGVLTFDFNARIDSGIDPALVVGRHVYAQFRHRDPNDPLGFAVGWTDAVRFVIAP